MTETILRPTSDIEKGWFYSTGALSGLDHQAVDAFDKTNRQWSENGADPFLHDADTTNYVYATTDALIDAYFTFTDSTRPSNYTIVQVRLIITAMTIAASDELVHLYLHDGTTEHDLGTFAPPADAYGDGIFIVTSILDTWAKINAAKLKIVKTIVKKAQETRVTYAELEVSWESPRTDYTEVDDVIPDDDTTRIQTSGSSNPLEDDLFQKPTYSLPAGEQIDKIRIYGVAAKVETIYSPYFWLLYKINGTKYTGVRNSPPVTYTEYYVEATLNPATGNPWTEADINNLEIGCKGQSYARCMPTDACTIYVYYSVKCTQIYLVVYSSPVVVAPRIVGNGLTWIQSFFIAFAHALMKSVFKLWLMLSFLV